MVDKKKIKTEILALLHESPTTDYLYIGSYFGNIDYFILKGITEEMSNSGLVTYDLEAWKNDEIAVKITDRGRMRVMDLTKKGARFRQARVWLKSGVLAGSMLLMGLVVVSNMPGFLGGDPAQPQFQASVTEEVSEKDALSKEEFGKDFVRTYLQSSYDDPDDFTTKILPSAENWLHMAVVCKRGRTCPYNVRYFVFEKREGEWDQVLNQVIYK